VRVAISARPVLAGGYPSPFGVARGLSTSQIGAIPSHPSGSPSPDVKRAAREPMKR